MALPLSHVAWCYLPKLFHFLILWQKSGVTTTLIYRLPFVFSLKALLRKAIRKLQKYLPDLEDNRQTYTTFGKFFSYLNTCLLTVWSRVLLDKLSGSQLVKKFHAFNGPRTFITAFTTAHHLPLSRARSIQSMPLHSTS